MIGEILGNYRLKAEIGKGGMARVYLAEHVKIGAQAAVKVLQPSLLGNQVMIDRFLTEARTTAAVKHPGIIDIFEFGELGNDGAYMIMEYLHGETMHRRMRRERRLPLDQALNMIRQIASALSAAHQAGIIHRDLKPDNIFLVPDSEVIGGERAKILDFGIAKYANGFGSGRSTTKTGVIIGTPDYMPPEQCKGLKDIDHRADLYSLGCILFKLLTGRTPFAEHATGEVISCHVLKAPPHPDSLVSTIPPNVSALILKLLEKKPEDRFASADEVLSVLETVDSCSFPRVTRAPEAIPQQLDPGLAFEDPASANPYVESAREFGRAIDTPNPRDAYTPVSTLSSAANYHTVGLPGPFAPPPRRRRYGFAVLAAIVLFGGAAFSTVHFLGVGSELVARDNSKQKGQEMAAVLPGESVAAPESVPVVVVGDNDTEAAPAAAAPVKKAIALEISSVPAGAEVYQLPDKARVGLTPLTLERDAFEGEYVFSVSRAGYRDYSLVFDARESGTHRAQLKKLPKPKTVTEKKSVKKPSKKRRRSKRRRASKPRPNKVEPEISENGATYDDTALIPLDE
ncbi:MAG: protein kinase [Proteobacteria bacterium]|nr:protein kinase [Pseudomonadota bacterium]